MSLEIFRTVGVCRAHFLSRDRCSVERGSWKKLKCEFSNFRRTSFWRLKMGLDQWWKKIERKKNWLIYYKWEDKERNEKLWGRGTGSLLSIDITITWACFAFAKDIIRDAGESSTSTVSHEFLHTRCTECTQLREAWSRSWLCTCVISVGA